MLWQVLVGFDPLTLLAFVLAGLLLNITPGVDFMFVTASSIAGGVRRGIGAAIGINLGILVHVLAATAGVSALLLAHPSAYEAIRFAGAAYLAYLAVNAWRAAARATMPAHHEPSLKRTIWQGFVTNVLNPKTALFIFAFIPQFTDPAIGAVWLQILILGLLFMVNGMLFSLALAAASGALSRKLTAHRALLNKISAFIFGGLALRLAFN